MIIKSKRGDPDHQISAAFDDFLVMHEEIRDEVVYDQLHTDLVEHLCRRSKERRR
jgi:hypothetical protein